MREENKYTVFIDTSSDKTQNPSKFKIKLRILNLLELLSILMEDLRFYKMIRI